MQKQQEEYCMTWSYNMNKELKAFLIQSLKSSKIASFDSWSGGESYRTHVFDFLKDRLGIINIDGKLYQVEYKIGGGVGMGAYPDVVVVKPITTIIKI